MDKKISTIKERVIQIAEYYQINKEKFFSEIGITSANFRSKQLKSALNSETVAKILSKYPDINSTWLLIGEGEMLNNQGIIQDPPTEYHNVIAEKEKIIEWLNRELKDKREIICHLIEESKQKNGEINKLKSELDMLKDELKKKEISVKQ